MTTAPGYADCSARLLLAAMARPAFVTFGCDPTSTDATQIAADLYGQFTGTGSFMSQMDSSVTLAEIIVRLGVDGAEDVVGSRVGTNVGQKVQASGPANLAILAHKRTARGGRRGRGRWYIPWYAASTEVAEDVTVTESVRAAKETALNVLRGAMATGANPMVVLHNPGISSPGPPNLVTAIAVSNLVGTQRRRLGR